MAPIKICKAWLHKLRR